MAPEPRDWQAAHGMLLLLAFTCLALVPPTLWRWPLPLVIPLLVYGGVVGAVRPLRRSMLWLRIGSLTPPLLGATLLVASLSVVVLLLCQHWLAPDLTHLQTYLPLDLFGSVALTAVAFALLNPVLEEAIFRGVLHQAIAAYWSAPVTVIATALLFGIGHNGGYPPGAIGAVLAGVFGLALGAIRHVSRGLLLPVLAHVAADATIAVIRIRAA